MCIGIARGTTGRRRSGGRRWPGLASALALIGVLADTGPHLLGLHLFSVVGFVFSGAFGLWLLWGIVKSGRL